MFSVKKKKLFTLFLSVVVFCMACTGKTEADAIKDEGASSLMEGSIEVTEDLPDSDMARQVALQIEDSINQVLADKEYYPHVIGISVNPECTEFNVTFSSRELSLYENVLSMSLCIVGDRFQLYQGKQENELVTVVNYVDADSGEIFSTANSKEIE